LREVWNDAACFVPPDDDSSLRDCLTVLIEDEQQLAAMGAAARARALEFTPKRMVDEYLRAYEELREQSVSAPAQQSNPTSPLPIQQEQIVTL
jgi:glycosyltransferase involved in cell wall biosynthesis